jgi:hypothetical protein
VTLLRKVVLAVIAVLLATEGTGVQVTASIVLLVSCLVAHMLFMPHRLPLLNTVEAASLTVAVVTLAGGAILVDDAAPTAWQTTATVLLVAVNGSFIICVVLLLLRSAFQDDSLKQMLSASVAAMHTSTIAKKKQLGQQLRSMSFRRARQPVAKADVPAMSNESKASNVFADSSRKTLHSAVIPGTEKGVFLPSKARSSNPRNS